VSEIYSGESRSPEVWNTEMDLHEWISGNSKVILRKRPGSARVGYDLNAAILPTKRNAAYRGSCLGRRQNCSRLPQSKIDSLELDSEWNRGDDHVCLPQISVQDTVSRYDHTENTIRKNGRKSSNISVKKYHHKPTLGVRSGTRMLNPLD
jgi:hypothetical protein